MTYMNVNEKNIKNWSTIWNLHLPSTHVYTEVFMPLHIDPISSFTKILYVACLTCFLHTWAGPTVLWALGSHCHPWAYWVKVRVRCQEGSRWHGGEVAQSPLKENILCNSGSSPVISIIKCKLITTRASEYLEICSWFTVLTEIPKMFGNLILISYAFTYI